MTGPSRTAADIAIAAFITFITSIVVVAIIFFAKSMEGGPPARSFPISLAPSALVSSGAFLSEAGGPAPSQPSRPESASSSTVSYLILTTARSAKVRREFQKQNPCPTNGHRTGACPGYVKDHRVPLACGGPDSTSNLQWQTIQEAKEKDKWELRCKKEMRTK